MIMEQVNTGVRTEDLTAEIKNNIDMNRGKFPDIKYHFKSLTIPVQVPSEKIDVNGYINKAVGRFNRSLSQYTVINSSYLDYYLKSMR